MMAEAISYALFFDKIYYSSSSFNFLFIFTHFRMYKGFEFQTEFFHFIHLYSHAKFLSFFFILFVRSIYFCPALFESSFSPKSISDSSLENSSLRGICSSSILRFNTIIIVQIMSQQQTKQIIHHLIKLGQQNEQISQNTGMEVFKQGQQINELQKNINQINKQGKKAEKTTKRISSFWYWVKDSLKNKLSSKSAQEEIKQEQEIKKIESKSNNFEKVEQKEQGCEINGLCEQLKRVKNMNKQIGSELSEQNKKLKKIDEKMDQGNLIIEKINKKMKKDILN